MRCANCNQEALRRLVKLNPEIIVVLLISCFFLASLPSVAQEKSSSSLATPGAVNTKPVKGQPYTIKLPGDVSLTMLWCPAGSFKMGSPKGEKGRDAYEALHPVKITQGFWLGQYEVTQGQYRAVMGENPSDFSGEDLRPVEQVSWGEALAFCHKINHLLSTKLPNGYRFTLPTEAQWEYACRAGSSSALNSGKELASSEKSCVNMEQLGWYSANSGDRTHSVGQKLPNAWGFFDMHGNVEEWCSDWYGDYQGAATNPTGPETGDYHVLRGGSWSYFARYCRSACRSNGSSEYSCNSVGFRPVLSLIQ